MSSPFSDLEKGILIHFSPHPCSRIKKETGNEVYRSFPAALGDNRCVFRAGQGA
ncbi:hypothetical protein D3OALGA1CA_3438 [Olavius algarvensis associated proteobacterium Delta 3]|nr:hypothetical protein D3OALGA1CA_3438 [Olavius algarvensis associated proteobacterium Delta 3]CAB5162621.1 hypothetical protein D3OALGB2SA_5526 [Olavius algarvensis associated proteobacterium Delta 3]